MHHGAALTFRPRLGLATVGNRRGSGMKSRRWLAAVQSLSRAGDGLSLRPARSLGFQLRWQSTGPAGVQRVKELQVEVARLVKARNWDAARAAGEDCCTELEQLTGKRHPGYASALNNLALIQKNRGDFEAASALYSEAVDVYKLVYGENHPSTALAIHNTAALCDHAHQP